jgi:cell division protein FtsW
LSDVTGHGFQVIQALAALNRGGMVGVGLGQSQQKFAIFAPHTDGLFAIIGEEWGLLGTLTVVIVYALWAWRGYRIAMRAADVYGRLLAVGIVSWVLFQAALHIAVLTASTPFTGTVLPLMSYGGSSLLTAMAAVGVLLNISRHTEEKRGSG